MNCKDLEELLSAYADGELARTQRDFVEEHLAGCADCRAILADYTKIRQQLTSLRVIPAIPDVKETTMSKIKRVNVLGRSRRWIRPAMVAMPIVAMLIALLSLHLSGSFLDPRGAIARAYAATEGLRSYRMIDSATTKWPGTTTWTKSYFCEFEYAGTNRYHMKKGTPKQYFPEDVLELIVIDDQIYSRELPETLSSAGIKRMVENAALGLYNSDIPSKEKTLGLLTSLIDLKRMPDENIDGTDCLHYWGRTDVEKALADAISRMSQRLDPSQPTYKELVKTLEDFWRTREIEVELWIGKDDYLIRQVQQIIQPIPNTSNIGGPTSVEIAKYYDFDKPVVIEAPVTESGELLAGWHLDYRE